MTQKIEMKQRKELIKKYLLRGISISDIAKALQINERYIRRDATDVKKQLLKEIKTEPVDQMLLKLSMATDETIRIAWQILYEKNTVMEKVRNASGVIETIEKTVSQPAQIRLNCLGKIMDAVEKQCTILSGLGILPSKNSPFMAVQNNLQIDTINHVNIYNNLLAIYTERKKVESELKNKEAIQDGNASEEL